ncbi:orotidine 5'-phosphate decarboxylase [Candidatus Bathyarchaeota archaeon]|nr:orotidine 5'-phosphate decarboxylase [Candidatus Bathyarchaeota archaeon]MBS7613550.1 orotidine 5'-phosphate decarboxylase [Candidatus Bathyarchaeota archaeon]MBS7617377.1 orotidine 5'-phosphate decarboxylase [Candidatus Bathyarchaeota archaeon]
MFNLKIEKSSRERKSRIVLALDIPEFSREKLYEKTLWIMMETSENVCAFKIGMPTILILGLQNGVSKLVEKSHEMGLPIIMDCKLSDVGHVNRIIAKLYFDVGFDALTVNPFVGFKDGLDSVLEEAKKRGRGVLPLVYMSHMGAEETFGQLVAGVDKTTRKQYLALVEKAKSWRVDGLIVGATRPSVIREVREIVGSDMPIFSPGVVFQGGSPKDALDAGATYLIIGRAICLSENPWSTSLKFKEISSFNV